jgi:two-component system, NtrC family, response regulator GlrR
MPGGDATRQVTSFRYRVARFRVRVARGLDEDAAASSSGTEVTIGSAEGNDLRLTDPSVSRHHCVLESTPEGVRVRDLGSTNGVVVSGCRVDSALLAPGVTLVLGDTQVVFERQEGDVTFPLSRDEQFGLVIGSSVAMRRLFALLPRLAASDTTVLIEGETGTGKSLLAESLHQQSNRSEGPFVVVDCSAIPPSLIESELFGHEKGSFTGAHAARTGYFESASGGTVFLDEIGELPLALQPKLLRILEERVIRRVGSHEPRRVDVRVLAATNRDLRHEVNRGAFRSDLWYRLAAVKLTIPPLRERPQDIPRLVEHFYAELSANPDARAPRELLERLSSYHWPGNVRELRNAVERAILFDDPTIFQEISGAPAPIDAPVDVSQPFGTAKSRAMARWEHAYLRELIGQHDGNISRAARAARMNRNHLRELLLRHRIPVPGRD